MHVNSDRLLNTQEGSNAKIEQSMPWQGKPACLRVNTDSMVLKGINYYNDHDVKYMK